MYAHGWSYGATRLDAYDVEENEKWKKQG